MNRSTLARRYLPLAVVLAVQLLIIAVVPSKAPSSTVAAGLTGGGNGLTSGGDQAAAGDQAAGDQTAAATGGTGGATGGATAGAVKAGQKFSGPVLAANGGINYPDGDRSHCVGDRQFDPSIFFWAPPCQGKFVGKASGPTYQGVGADDKIEILWYRGKPNPAVDAILTAEQANSTTQQNQQFASAVEKFMNSHFEFWGRHVHIDVAQGSCDSVPPDYRCLRGEVDQFIQQYKPYFIMWNTSLASPFFAQASFDKVPNAGGWHFRDSFNQQYAPYHWDVQQSGTQMLNAFGDFYCQKFNGKQAKYAGAPRYAGETDLRTANRVLGVIATNDPENKKAMEVDLKAALAKCGASFAHSYYYAQDISTADQQRKAGVAAMMANPESTGVLCFCDLVAPAFLYETEEEDHYHPENFITGAGYMDADASGRAYDTLLPGDPSCGCNHEYENAFGLSQIEAQEPVGRDAAARVYHAGGASGDPPYKAAGADLDYLMMIGTLIQQAGPTLTPQTMQVGATHTAPRGGGNHIRRSFSNGDFTWNDDMRQVWWSPTQVSGFDGKPGSYHDMFPGQRFLPGQYAGDFVLPPKPR